MQMPVIQALNPNQVLPPVLASPLCPPPIWPNNEWVSLPVVQLGTPMGPYNTTTGCCQGGYTGPLGTGLWPGPSFCPGSGLGGIPPGEDGEDDGTGGTSAELGEVRRELRREARERHYVEEANERIDRERRERTYDRPPYGDRDRDRDRDRY